MHFLEDYSVSKTNFVYNTYTGHNFTCISKYKIKYRYLGPIRIDILNGDNITKFANRCNFLKCSPAQCPVSLKRNQTLAKKCNNIWILLLAKKSLSQHILQ